MYCPFDARKPSLGGGAVNQKLCRNIVIQHFKKHMFWIFVRIALPRQNIHSMKKYTINMAFVAYHSAH